MLSETYTTRQFYGEPPGQGQAMSLSLCIGPASFMYAISTRQYKVVHEIGHVAFTAPGLSTEPDVQELQRLVQNFFLDQKSFEKVNIALLNRNFTMVPEAYSQDDLKPMLRFASGATAITTSQRHHLKGLFFCHSPEPELTAYLEKTFSNASLRHAGAVSLGLLFGQHSLAGSQVFLHLGDAGLELAIRNGSNLLFYNVFPVETNEDVLYYLLFTLEQFGLDPQQVRLSIAAQRSAADPLMAAIKRYVKQVAFCVHDPLVSLAGRDLLQVPQHYYFILLNQHLCEL